MTRPIALILSPYRVLPSQKFLRQDLDDYLGELVRWSAINGMAPYASHSYLPRWLDDENPQERKLGFEVEAAFLPYVQQVIVGTRYGASSGMESTLRKLHNTMPCLLYGTYPPKSLVPQPLIKAKILLGFRFDDTQG
jgi:hypothetical protein